MKIVSYTLHVHLMICGYATDANLMSVVAREIINNTLHGHFMICGYVAMLQMQT